jgi:hypothetical protein
VLLVWQTLWPVIERLEWVLFGLYTNWLELKRTVFRVVLVLTSFALAATIPMFGKSLSTIHTIPHDSTH